MFAEPDVKRIVLALHRIGQADDRNRVTLEQVLPDRLLQTTRRIVKNCFGPIRTLRFAHHSIDEIDHEVRIWMRNNQPRPYLWEGCDGMGMGNFRYCERHRNEITEIARTIC